MKNIKVNTKFNSHLKDHSCGGKEHNTWSRRSFLSALGLAGAGSIMMSGLPVMASSSGVLANALAATENDRVLVMIRLKGGNDGLNTVIPIYDYDTYAAGRPTIKINQSDSFNLNSNFAMPNFMNSLESMWGDGKMKVAHGVGYDDQNLSHFRSSDIWSSSSDADEVVDTGWLGRYYDELYPDFLFDPPSSPAAIQIGSIGNLDFFGADDTNYSFTVTNPTQLYELAQNGWLHDVENIPDCLYGDQLAYMRSIANATFIYAGVINESYEAASNDVSYGATSMDEQLALVARLIKGNLGTKVYLVTLDGFDTHAEQADDHQALLTQVADAVKSFFDDLSATGHDEKVLAMTFSEFGRRIEENASGGTDHGAAAPAMFFGPALDGNGFVGEHPDLTNDVDFIGNLQNTTDFRQIYATFLEEWFCIEPSLVNEVLMDNYERLNLGFECITSVPEISPDAISHQAINMNNGDVTISYNLPKVMDVEIQIFNTMGQLVSSIPRQTQMPGIQKVSVRSNSGRLAAGHYTYRIVANRKAYSKSFVYRN